MTRRRNDSEVIREEGVNVLLAQTLRNRGLSARAERRSKEGIPDLRIDLGSGDLVILECKWAGSAGLFETQLNGRLTGFPDALGVIGVVYPDRLRRADNIDADLEATGDLQWWLHGSRGEPTKEPHVRGGTVAELADELRTLPLQLEGVDRVAAAAGAVGYALEQAAVQISKHARISRRIADIIANTDQEKDRTAALRIGCLVLFNALAFQDRLAVVNEDVPTVDEALGQDIAGLRQAWRYICDEIDYVPVFELAAKILDVLRDGPAEIQMPVLVPLVKAVRDTRRPRVPDDASRRTTFVNLWQNPDGVLGAHRLARAVTTTTPARIEKTGTALLEIDGHHVGELFSMPESKLAGKKWAGVQFARADVVRSALRLLDDGELWVPGGDEGVSISLCRIGELGQIGPDVRDVRDGFEPTDSVTAYPMVEGNDTEKRTRLRTEPDKYLSPLAKPRPGRNLKSVTQLWPKAGNVLVAERLRLNTARVVAMRTDTPVLSNVWWPIKTNNQVSERAITVWLNSSAGLVTLLAIRNTTQGSWVKLKKADLEELPILDTRRLSPEQLAGMSDLFDEMAEEEFERLPAMAHCPARRRLDEGVSEILGLPDLGKLRELLASEPVVSGRRL